MDWKIVAESSLPEFPSGAETDEDIRHPYLKARAYLIFAVEEYQEQSEGFDIEQDLEAALVTANTHGLPLDLEPDEYLLRAIRELATLEEYLDESQKYPTFKHHISDYRHTLETFQKG